MRFLFLDAVLERSATTLTAIKHVAADEPYLEDHFPTFPVMPGVLMLEALVQAARRLAGEDDARLVLREVKAVRYGAFVRPGDTLRLRVELLARPEAADGPEARWRFKGQALALRPAGQGEDVACAGRFALGPVRTAPRKGPVVVKDAVVAAAQRTVSED